MNKSKRKSKIKPVKIGEEESVYIDCSPDLPEFLHVDIKEEPENSEDEVLYVDAPFFAQVQNKSQESQFFLEKKNISNRKNLSVRLAKKSDAKSYEILEKDTDNEMEVEKAETCDKRQLRNATHSKKRLNLADDSDSDYIERQLIKKLKLKASKTKFKRRIKKNGIVKKELQHCGTIKFKTAQKCKFCDYLSKNVPNLKRHEQTHTAGKKIPCDVCGKIFALEQYMKTHRARHFSTVRYECETCHKQFTRLDNMRRHRILHDDFKPYGCELCDFYAHTCEEIVSHVDEHPDSIFPCSFCNKKFNHSTYLRNHILTHTEGRENECEICGLGFAREETLTIHMRSHINTRPFPCFVCNRRFSRRHHLEVHSMSHTNERPFACDLCETRFKHIDTLKKHKRKHQFLREFGCDLCDKTFVTKAGLKSHAFLHTGDKPFKCEVCDKSFIQYKSLLSHRLSHRQDGPFECARCSRAFMTLVAFNKHVKEAHKGEPLPELPNLNKKRTVIVREIVKNVLGETIKRSHESEDRNSEQHEKDKCISNHKSHSYVTINKTLKDTENVVNNSKNTEEITEKKVTLLYAEQKVRAISNQTHKETVEKTTETKQETLPKYELQKTKTEIMNYTERTSHTSSPNALNPAFPLLTMYNYNSFKNISDGSNNNLTKHSDNYNDCSSNPIDKNSDNCIEHSLNHMEHPPYKELISNLSKCNAKLTQRPSNFNISTTANEEQVNTEKTNLNEKPLNFSELNQVERALSYLERTPLINERLATEDVRPILYIERTDYMDRSLGYIDRSYGDRSATERPLLTFSGSSIVYPNLNKPQLGLVLNEQPLSYSERRISEKYLNDRLISSVTERSNLNLTERYPDSAASEVPMNYTQNILDYNENLRNTLLDISPLMTMAHRIPPVHKYYSTSNTTYNPSDVAINYHVDDRTTPKLSDERMHVLPENQRYYDHQKYPEFYANYNVTPPLSQDRVRRFEDDPYEMSRNVASSHLNFSRLDHYINTVQTQLLDYPSNETYKKIHSFFNRLDNNNNN